MNISIKNPPPLPPKSKSYPWLGIHNDIVVLFTKLDAGLCVRASRQSVGVGTWSTCWSEHAFEPFEGTVTLSND